MTLHEFPPWLGRTGKRTRYLPRPGVTYTERACWTALAALFWIALSACFAVWQAPNHPTDLSLRPICCRASYAVSSLAAWYG